MKILIKSVGFIGDNLFASSVISKLKKDNPSYQIDFLCTKVQPFELINNNPDVNNVYLEEPSNNYDLIYQLQPIHRKSTPCEQFQSQCGVLNPSPDYKIYTNSSLDKYVYHNFKEYKKDKKIIAWLSNWEERSFLFTKEEYIKGIDVPNLGYGGKHRNISYIISKLTNNKDCIFIEIGGKNTNEVDLNTVSEYSLTASILKHCDYFIGAEGGLANLAAGVGTKTIITGDFVHQLYGWNGVIEKCEEPKLGPKYYFSDNNHITLDPYLTDDEVIININNVINGI